PARTHHCSICSRCILKMDHHCPWLNNCVGHFNHRYFFSFCLFMTMACIYCSISAKDMFLDAYNAIEVSLHELLLWSEGEAVPGAGLIYISFSHQVESSYQTPPPAFTRQERMVHKSLVYLWVLTSSVAVALGGLTLWHAMLISRGETSVERHINRKERKRLRLKGKVFRNPYHRGKINNWKIFFGVEKQSDWLTRVLLPSGHLPHGDGLTWDCPSHRSNTMAI
uniref:Palmitoyltransferase n=1 Tax=Cyprinus carpio TaxID=7962 RepID=A0A8C2ASY1_CYPCA